MHQDCFLLSLFVQLRLTLLFSQMMKQKMNEGLGKAVCVRYNARQLHSQKK